VRVADRNYSDQPSTWWCGSADLGFADESVAAGARVLSLGSGIQIRFWKQFAARLRESNSCARVLQVGEVSAVTMPDQPVDAVLIQNPKPGAGAANAASGRAGSQGAREAAYVMPHLTG